MTPTVFEYNDMNKNEGFSVWLYILLNIMPNLKV